LEVRICEHKKSIQKRDPDISKLFERHYTTGHRILWNEAEIIGQEQHWRARKIQEAEEILKGGESVFRSPSVEINHVWKPIIQKIDFKNTKKSVQPPPRRSRRIEERERASSQQKQQQHSDGAYASQLVADEAGIRQLI
jgi:hypothetical protein